MMGFCNFGEEIVCLQNDLETKYIFFPVDMCECSSVVEHSTADREVGGSIPLAPCSILMGYLSKGFRLLKDQLSSIF